MKRKNCIFVTYYTTQRITYKRTTAATATGVNQKPERKRKEP